MSKKDKGIDKVPDGENNDTSSGAETQTANSNEPQKADIASLAAVNTQAPVVVTAVPERKERKKRESKPKVEDVEAPSCAGEAEFTVMMIDKSISWLSDGEVSPAPDMRSGLVSAYNDWFVEIGLNLPPLARVGIYTFVYVVRVIGNIKARMKLIAGFRFFRGNK